MDQITTEVRSRSWAAIVAECNGSQMTKQEWCRQNDVNIKSFYYWQRKLRKESSKGYPAFGFSELKVESPTAYGAMGSAVVEKDGMRIEITETASEEFMRKLLRAVSYA